jgi:hypothetical protein
VVWGFLPKNFPDSTVQPAPLDGLLYFASGRFGKIAVNKSSVVRGSLKAGG